MPEVCPGGGGGGESGLVWEVLRLTVVVMGYWGRGGEKSSCAKLSPPKSACACKRPGIDLTPLVRK